MIASGNILSLVCIARNPHVTKHRDELWKHDLDETEAQRSEIDSNDQSDSVFVHDHMMQTRFYEAVPFDRSYSTKRQRHALPCLTSP